MMAHDDDFLDLVAVLALGSLPEAEARRVASHLATCDTCRALFADLRPAADLIGYANEPAVLDELTSARMKARLMRVVRADVERVAPRRQAAPAAGWFAAAAAIVLAVLVGADDLAFRNSSEHAAARQRSELAAADAQVIALLAPGGKHFAVPQGEVVASAGRIVMAMKLAPLPAGKVYEVWTLPKGAKAVQPSVTFSPAANGVAIVEIPVDPTGLAAVAVSVEPAGGSKAPTSSPTFVRKLS
jgi:anti-sigma-K factor RskA